MVEKAEGYWLLRVLLPLVAVGGIIVLYGGLARGLVPRPPGPSGSTGVIVLALGAGGVAYGAVNALEARSLGAAGNAAGLSADGIGVVGRPPLSGQRRDRPVEVRVVKDTDSASARRGTEETLFTVVATTLDQPTKPGLVVGRSDAIGSGTDSANPVRREADGIAVLSGVDGAAEHLIDQHNEAFDGVDLDSPIYAGDVSGILLGSADTSLSSMAYDLAESQIPSSEAAVVHKSKGLVFDGEILDRRVEAVVTVAAAIDEGRTD